MEETFREFHQRSGATMIYVTHDQSEAMALATDVAVMSEGRLLQVAPPAEIYARPEGHVVGGLIGRGAVLTLPVMGSERHLEWDELQDALQAANTDGADILVRPEDVIIGGEGAPAVVETVLFEGERYAVKLTLGNGQTLRAFSRVAVLPGEAVRVVIRAGWRLDGGSLDFYGEPVEDRQYKIENRGYLLTNRQKIEYLFRIRSSHP
jgi:iron(III) transport system ATP-binding protein